VHIRPLSSATFAYAAAAVLLTTAVCGGGGRAYIFSMATPTTGRGLTSTQPPDLTRLEELVNQHVTGVYAVPAKPQIVLFAIDSSVSPPWALVDWGFFPGGGEIAAAKNKSGTWSQKFASGGIFTTQELISHGMPSAVATYLKAHIQPLPTQGTVLRAVASLQDAIAKTGAAGIVKVYAYSSESKYVFVRYLLGNGGGDALLISTTIAGTPEYDVRRAGGGQMSADTLSAFGVPKAIAKHLIAFSSPKGCPSRYMTSVADARNLVPHAVVCIVD
jgi:hypothetical protein